MKVKAVQCQSCKDIIYSRARHDFHTCTCKKTYVDGGFDDLRCGGDVAPTALEIEINATKNELFRDWNRSEDKFGIIHE